MAPNINRQWLLKKRPKGLLTRDDLDYRESPAPDGAHLPDGGLLLRHRVFLCAPTIRNWMEPPGNSLYPSIPLGAAILAPAGSEVLASARPGIAAGQLVTTLGSWQDMELVGADHAVAAIPAGLTLLDAMGPFGLNPLTACAGLLYVGEAKAGDTLVVSGAAGSVGSVAAQIGRILGCRVIGIAGGAEKCRWLRETLHLDGAVDYKRGRVEDDLRALAPNGINVFFDNVGGPILQAAIETMAPFGRIVLCGQIASYNRGGPAPGPTNMMRLIYGSIRMQGFLQRDYAGETETLIARLRQWMDSGQLLHREDVRAGFAGIPDAFNSLFDGSNRGTLLVTTD